MSRLSATETALADRLRQEALAARPAFSEDLHARLCAALRSCPAGMARPRPAARSRWFRAAPVAAAVCLLLVVGVTWIVMKNRPDAGLGSANSVAHRTVPGVGNAHRKADARSMNAMVSRMSTNFDGIVDLAVRGPRRFYLDRNLRLALQTPMVRVPVDVISSLLSITPQKRPRPASPAGPS